MGMVDRHKVVSFALLVIFVIIYNGSISFGHANLGNNVFVTYICGLAGTLMWLIGCILLTGSKMNKEDLKIMAWIKWFGKNSFNAMAIHNPIKGFVCVIVSVVLHCGS